MLGDRFWHRYSRGERNVTLLLSLIVLFMLYPISVELGMVRFYRLVFVVELILASISLGTTKGHRRLGVGLGVWPFALPFPVRITTIIGDPIDLEDAGPIDPNDRPALLAAQRRVAGAVQALLTTHCAS